MSEQPLWTQWDSLTRAAVDGLITAAVVLLSSLQLGMTLADAALSAGMAGVVIFAKGAGFDGWRDAGHYQRVD